MVELDSGRPWRLDRQWDRDFIRDTGLDNGADTVDLRT